MSRSHLGALLALCLAGCSHGDAATGLYPVANDGGLVLGTEEGIRDFVLAGGTADWVREPGPHPSVGPHGRVQSAFNDPYLTSRRGEQYPMPVGAASAKEIFRSDGGHQGWAVGIKVGPGNGPDTWVWWEAFAPDHGPHAYGVGIFVCERCHGDSMRDRSLTATVP